MLLASSDEKSSNSSYQSGNNSLNAKRESDLDVRKLADDLNDMITQEIPQPTVNNTEIPPPEKNIIKLLNREPIEREPQAEKFQLVQKNKIPSNSKKSKREREIKSNKSSSSLGKNFVLKSDVCKSIKSGQFHTVIHGENHWVNYYGDLKNKMGSSRKSIPKSTNTFQDYIIFVKDNKKNASSNNNDSFDFNFSNNYFTKENQIKKEINVQNYIEDDEDEEEDPVKSLEETEKNIFGNNAFGNINISMDIFNNENKSEKVIEEKGERKDSDLNRYQNKVTSEDTINSTINNNININNNNIIKNKTQYKEGNIRHNNAYNNYGSNIANAANMNILQNPNFFFQMNPMLNVTNQYPNNTITQQLNQQPHNNFPLGNTPQPYLNYQNPFIQFPHQPYNFNNCYLHPQSQPQSQSQPQPQPQSNQIQYYNDKTLTPTHSKKFNHQQLNSNYSSYTDESIAQLSPFLIKEQGGCRFIQEKAANNHHFANKILFPNLLNEMTELICDPFGNYLFQVLLDVLSRDNLELMFNIIISNFISIAVSPHGTRVIQKMIERIISDPPLIEKFNIVFFQSIVLISKDPYGNHIVQKYLSTIPYPNNQFVFDIILKNFLEITNSKHGCCVIQKCLSEGRQQQRNFILTAIQDNIYHIIRDQFGIYIIQYIIISEMNWSEVKRIVDILKDNIVYFGKQNFSSNVLEKCFECSRDEIKKILLDELLRDDNNVKELILDVHGNYVVQKALLVSKGEEYKRLLFIIAGCIKRIKKTQYGNKLIAKLLAKHKDLGVIIMNINQNSQNIGQNKDILNDNEVY